MVHIYVNMLHSFSMSTPRQQKREVTFERIIVAAMRALSKGGLDSLTMQTLAEGLGFAVGALYRYFPSKDALMVAVQRRIIETIHHELAAALTRADAHVAKSADLNPRRAALLRLWVAAQVYESMAKERPTEFGLLSMTLGDPRQLVKDDDAGQLVPSMAELFGQVGGLFASGVEAGALSPGDPARRTLVLWTSVQGALQLRKLERFPLGALDASALLVEAVSTLLIGWGAPADDARAMHARAQQLRTPHSKPKH